MSNRRRTRTTAPKRLRHLLDLWPCPWCPATVVLDTVEATWDFLAMKPTPAQAFDAVAGWHCHGCGSAGVVMPR